jgi:hypothetical protein
VECSSLIAALELCGKNRPWSLYERKLVPIVWQILPELLCKFLWQKDPDHFVKAKFDASKDTPFSFQIVLPLMVIGEIDGEGFYERDDVSLQDEQRVID